MHDAHAVSGQSQPLRVLGTRDAACVVIGAIIGVGIFLTPGGVATATGTAPLALLAWGIAGLIAICGAMVFAELGGRFHSSGAQHQVLRDAYGPFTAYLFVFCNTTAIECGSICIMAIPCATYGFVAATGSPVTDAHGPLILGMAAILIIGLSTANALGVRWGARIQNITVVAKLLTLFVVAGLAMAFGSWPSAAFNPAPETSTRTLGPVAGVLAALVPAFYAYGGWQQALWIAGEVREPRRTLPRAIIGGVVIVIVVYMLANWAYLHLLGVERVATSRTVAADAVGAALAGRGSIEAIVPRIVAGAVALSAFGVLNVQFLSAPRLVYALSRDGRFFSPFGRLSPRFGTPIAAISLMAIMSLVVLFSVGADGLGKLLTGVMFIDGIFFVLTGAAVMVLRRKTATYADAAAQADASASYRVPFYPIVPLVFVIGMLGVVAGAYVDKEVRSAASIGVAFIAAAAVMYAIFFRDSRKTS